MITLGEMQISGVLSMLILSAMLILCVPERSARRGSFAKARWMMSAGTGLIALQFLTQYIFGFRQMGITQGVLFNLLFFTPASMICGMAVLYVQRQGRVSLREWLTGAAVCIVSALLLTATVLLDGVPIEQESPVLRKAEYVGAALYVVMQGYVFRLQYRTYKQLRKSVEEYFDRERLDLLRWMGLSMKAMLVLSFFVPIVIFFDSQPLTVFSFAYLFSVTYTAVKLYSYAISKDVERVEEAEESKKEVERSEQPAVTSEDLSSVAEAVSQWRDAGGFREHNLTLATVARQMGLTQKQLQEWLRQSEYKKLSGLVTSLRIEDAKRVLKESPDWSVETVASFCGFNDRKYFHQVFQQHTGTTPLKFQQEESIQFRV